MKVPRSRYRICRMGVWLFAVSLVLGGVDFSEAAGGPGGDFHVFPDAPMANDFRMKGLDGKAFKLSDLKGKVVLLNFWRSNCPWCEVEKGYLKTMVKEIKRPDLEVLSVNLWDSREWVHSNHDNAHNEMRVAMKADDKDTLLENKVGGRVLGYYVLSEAREAIYEIKGFPSTYVIDKHGRVVATHLGMAKWTKASVREWLNGLLGPQPAPVSRSEAETHLPSWIDGLLTHHGAGTTTRSGSSGTGPGR